MSNPSMSQGLFGCGAHGLVCPQFIEQTTARPKLVDVHHDATLPRANGFQGGMQLRAFSFLGQLKNIANHA